MADTSPKYMQDANFFYVFREGDPDGNVIYDKFNKSGTFRGSVRGEPTSATVVTDTSSWPSGVASTKNKNPSDSSSSNSIQSVVLRLPDGSTGTYQVDSEAYDEAVARGATPATSSSSATIASPSTQNTAANSITTTSAGLTTSQQQLYNQLTADGAPADVALQAVQQIPGQGSTVDTSTAPPGISQEDWNKLDPGTQAALSGIQTVLQQQLEQNQPVPVALTDKDLDALYKQAQQDPLISQYYGDRLNVGQTQFQQDLSYLQGTSSQESQELQRQIESDRRALAEQKAAAGEAYSGFRQKAAEELGQTQSGIVQSSKRDLQKNLTDLTQAFEEKYGTSATNPAVATYQDPYASSNVTLSGLTRPVGTTTTGITGATIGGVAGSENTGKLTDIEQKYQDLIAKSLQQQGATT